MNALQRLSVLIIILILTGSNVFAAPAISGVTGSLNHGQTITIHGSGFGAKSPAAPLVYDNLSQDQTGQPPSTTATIGQWASVGDFDSVSDTMVRHNKGTKSAYCNINGEKFARFQGGYDSPSWFVQYWFYLGANWVWTHDITYSLGNVKVFRMWSTGSDVANVHVNLMYANEVLVTSEYLDQDHNWSPVVPGYDWVANIYGRTPGYVCPGTLGWSSFPTEWSTGVWHNIRFEFRDSTINVSDGVIRMWFDGKLVLDHSDFLTRNSSNTAYKRPNTVGFYNARNANGTDSDFYMTDVYIDNTWARVEIGNASTYANCTHIEIQPPTAWSSDSISVTLNQGSFNDGQTVYLYVRDADGSTSDGYAVTLGETDTTPPTLNGCVVTGAVK